MNGRAESQNFSRSARRFIAGSGKTSRGELEKEPDGRPVLGGCLRIWLVALIMLNASVAFFALVPFNLDAIAPGQIRSTVPLPTDWKIWAWFVLGIANCIFLLRIWNWRRWGVYAAVIGNLVLGTLILAMGGLNYGGPIVLSYGVGVGILIVLACACRKQIGR